MSENKETEIKLSFAPRNREGFHYLYKLNPNKEVVPANLDEPNMPHFSQQLFDRHVRVPRYRKPKRGGHRKPARTCSIRISTIFLSLDMDLGSNEKPTCFETMIFVDDHSPLEYFCRRYSSYKDAQSGHAKMVRKVLMVHRGRV